MKFKIKGIQFSTEEIRQLLISLLVLSFAFSLVLYKSEIFVNNSNSLLSIFNNYSLIFFFNSLLVVGLAFILHEELGHKIVAQRFGYQAEYKYLPIGLVLAVFLAIFSKGNFVFILPGAVMISAFGLHRHINKEKMGQIAVAGSVVNIILAIIFITLSLIFTSKLFAIGAWVNAFLALFNMLPIGILDGAKVLKWDKRIWVSILTSSFILFIISGMIQNMLTI